MTFQIFSWHFDYFQVLNEKFSGDIDKSIPSTFPDEYFTCSVRCMSCKERCSKTMNHTKDDVQHTIDPSKRCQYQHQFDNKVFICKVSQIAVHLFCVVTGEVRCDLIDWSMAWSGKQNCIPLLLASLTSLCFVCGCVCGVLGVCICVCKNTWEQKAHQIQVSYENGKYIYSQKTEDSIHSAAILEFKPILWWQCTDCCPFSTLV